MLIHACVPLMMKEWERRGWEQGDKREQMGMKMECTKRAKVEMVNDEKKIKLSWEETKEACVTSFLKVVSGRALPLDTYLDRYNSLPQSAMCIKVGRNMGGL